MNVNYICTLKPHILFFKKERGRRGVTDVATGDKLENDSQLKPLKLLSWKKKNKISQKS